MSGTQGQEIESIKPRVGQHEGTEESETGRPTGEMLDEASERRVRRKLDRVVVPLTFALYLCAFLDRSNIGNAETAGMGEDLGFDDAHYQVGPMLFRLEMGRR